MQRYTIFDILVIVEDKKIPLFFDDILFYKNIMVLCNRSKNRAASPPSICTWWNWNETVSLVLNHSLRYLPHITIGLRNLSVYWLTMQSSSVWIIAEVPTIM